MKYIAYKPQGDSLFFCHGIFLPDGYFRVFEMTRWNGKNVESMQNRGYQIEEEEEGRKCGLYHEASGKRVDEASVVGALDLRSGVQVRFLDDDAPEEDPLATLGMPDELIRKTFAERIGKVQSKADIAAVQQELQMRARAGRR